MEKAIKAVNNNELDQAASVAFDVPGSTLHDKLIAKPNKNGSLQKQVDTFTEEKLAIYLKLMAKWRCLKIFENFILAKVTFLFLHKWIHSIR